MRYSKHECQATEVVSQSMSTTCCAVPDVAHQHNFVAAVLPRRLVPCKVVLHGMQRAVSRRATLAKAMVGGLACCGDLTWQGALPFCPGPNLQLLGCVGLLPSPVWDKFTCSDKVTPAMQFLLNMKTHNLVDKHQHVLKCTEN